MFLRREPSLGRSDAVIAHLQPLIGKLLCNYYSTPVSEGRASLHKYYCKKCYSSFFCSSTAAKVKPFGDETCVL